MVKKIILALLFLFLFVPKALADDQFASSYDVLYDIEPSGITTVTEKITLTNLTSQYYASQFKLIIGATQISDIKASDGGGSMEVKSNQVGSTTEINVKFNLQIAGIKKTLPWTLLFKSKDFAEKQGKVWEVRAPKISSSTNLSSYNLTLAVPREFGDPTAISPTPKSQSISGNKMFLSFDASQLKQSGVSASFGTHQLFDFDLSYHLENNSLVPVLTNIALPPDTAYQDVIYQRIEPKPLNVTVDDDGNYLAWYKLNRNEKTDVKVTGSGKLVTLTKVKNPVLDNNLRKKYTQADKYWEKDHPQIQGKLTEIIGNTQDNGEKVKLIYLYVVNFLKYDSNRLKKSDGGVERYGAVTALNNPTQAVCMEFTDLFIALVRAANIPARELDGFAYTANQNLRPLSLSKDVLHAWPEYWDDRKGWVMVDPTWENTTQGVDYFNKFDLNHFAFVVKGSSSLSPIPAGSYKYVGEDTHDVKVNLSETDFLGSPRLDVQIISPDPILAGFPSKLKIKVANLGNSIFPGNNLVLQSSKLIFLGAESQNLGPVPSFGAADFELDLRTKSLFDKYNDQIIVLIGNQKFVKDVSVRPFVIFQTVPLVSVGIGLIIGLIYLGVLGARLYDSKFSGPNKNSS